MMLSSVQIAQILGPFYIIMGLSLFFNKEQYIKMLKDLKSHPLTMLYMGILVLLIGLIMITLNTQDNTALSIIITIIGWMATLKGAFALVFPQMFSKITDQLSASTMMFTFGGLVALILGLYLSTMGF